MSYLHRHKVVNIGWLFSALDGVVTDELSFERCLLKGPRTCEARVRTKTLTIKDCIVTDMAFVALTSVEPSTLRLLNLASGRLRKYLRILGDELEELDLGGSDVLALEVESIKYQHLRTLILLDTRFHGEIDKFLLQMPNLEFLNISSRFVPLPQKSTLESLKCLRVLHASGRNDVVSLRKMARELSHVDFDF